jgi:prevent-host-death family protein
MGSMAASEAREKFADTLNRVAYGRERVVLERHGKPAVALVPIEDLELLQALEDRADLADARAALAEGGAVPWEQIKSQLGL